MKEKILKLRAEGKTYDQIKAELGCSKATISYHCGEGQKEKFKNRLIKYRSKNTLLRKVDSFKQANHNLKCKSFRFQEHKDINFNYKDVIEKFGINTKCYLTGENINLINDRDYQFDHIIPKTKGGDNSINNLGILKNVVNKMKHNLLNEELFIWCKKILEYNGYIVTIQ